MFKGEGSDLLGPLFGDADVAEQLSDRARLQAMLDVEAALADVEAELGVVPRSAVEPIRAAADAGRYDVRAIAAAAARDGNLAIPLVRHLTKDVEAIRVAYDALEPLVWKSAPLATTSIGSFPRPHWLAKTNVTRAAFVVPPEGMQEACDDATVLVLRHQENLGLDVVTDGEQRREGFIFHIAGQWNGVDTQNLALKERYRNRIMNQMVPRIVGKVTRRSPAGRRRPPPRPASADRSGPRPGPSRWPAGCRRTPRRGRGRTPPSGRCR